MTREEAITVLNGLSDNPLFSDQHRAAFKIAIHDIKANHNWALNNLILINKDNYEPLDQEPRKDEVILTNNEYRKQMANEYDHGYCKGYAEAVEDQKAVLDKLRGEIVDYGSIWVTYAITGRKDSDIERLIKGVLKQAKEQVLEIIDKYRAESEGT